MSKRKGSQATPSPKKKSGMADITKVRVAIIGAGPSGTAALRAFQSAKSKGADIPEIVCYEKQSEVGGLWNYNWRTGVTEHGEAVHGSMYRYLWSNGPKEVLEFADYTFEEHFGRIIPSFPPREVLFDYIKGRLNKADVKDWIKLNTIVRDTKFDEKTQKFTIVSRELTTQVEETQEFDYVICASGHFSAPHVPYFEGFEKFQGRVLHAHDFRDALEFKGKNILIVGTSYSAEDIASQCYKYGVGSVTCSYRTAPMTFHWPKNFKTVPLLTKVEGNTAHFRADPERGHPEPQTAEIDAIILCTGYKHHFPFLSDELRLKTANRLVPGPEGAKGDGDGTLYKGVAWDRNPRLMYLGMQDQWFTFNMFDAQAWWARDVILGRLQIPDKKGMGEDFAKWRTKELTLKTDEDMFTFQGDYVKSLHDLTDYPTYDIAAACKSFVKWEEDKHNDIMGFRNNPHPSVMTGNMGTVHHTPWLEALDDSLECYLKDKKDGAKTD